MLSAGSISPVKCSAFSRCVCDGGCSDPNNFAPIPILIAVPIVLYVVYLLAVKVCAAEGYRHSNLSCVWCTLCAAACVGMCCCERRCVPLLA